MNARYLLSGLFAVAAIGLLGAYSSGSMSPSEAKCSLGCCTDDCFPPGGCVEPCCADCPDCCDFSESSAPEAFVLPCCQAKATAECCASKAPAVTEAPAEDE